MNRVAIVDDERIVKLAVKSMIDWTTGEFELAGTASDGAEALELVRREGVDIVVTDLKMPRMDGLGLIAGLKALPDPPEVLVLSNFDDFALVREAMRGGALDYILKTDVSAETLMAAMREAAAAVKARRASGGSGDRAAILDAAKDGGGATHGALAAAAAAAPGAPGAVPGCAKSGRGFFLEAMGDSRIASLTAAFDEARRDEGRSGLSGVLIAAVAHDPASSGASAGMLKALGEQGLKTCARCAIAQGPSGAILLMPLFAENSGFDAERAVSWIADQARLYYGSLLGMTWSAPFREGEGLARAYEECSQASELFFYAANAGTAFPASERPGPPRELLAEMEKRAGAEARGSEGCVRALRSLVQRCADLNVTPPCLKGMVSRLAAAAPAIAAPSAAAPSASGFLAAVAEAVSDAELLSLLAEGLREEESGGPSVCRAEVRRALDYIEERAFEKFSLSELSKAVGLSESYLCTIFKAQTGKSIVSYVNDLRLDRAMDLLRTGRYLVKEVASVVGIDDPFYFNRLFKRRFNLSPSEAAKR